MWFNDDVFMPNRRSIACSNSSLRWHEKERLTLSVSILDVIQKAELVCRSENTNSLNPKTHVC